MQQLDINVAAYYLLMAATLAHIKSRMLLLAPSPGNLDEENGGDPRAELARRLAEYAVFKEVAIEFDRRPCLDRAQRARPHRGERQVGGIGTAWGRAGDSVRGSD